MKEFGGKLIAEGIRFAIIISRFNDFLTGHLLSGARDCIVRHGGNDELITVFWVPGANELPLLADKVASSGNYDAIVALGAVVQGATPHADLINHQASRSLAATALKSGVPVVNGIVCAQTLEQAIERCGTKAGNKGWAAAQAAIEMADLYRQIA